MDEAEIRAIERPHPNLMKMYLLQAIAANILFPIVIWPLYFKYHTLRYRIDDEGVSASWGILFKREIHLTYKRIQDIHVKRNVFERWLGIGTVEVQTASGNAGAELSLEGMGDHGAVRDYLYRRMRGQADAPARSAPDAAGGASSDTADAGELVDVLRGIRAELAGARAALERRGA